MNRYKKNVLDIYNKRIIEIDFIRGLALILMFMQHFIFDLRFFFHLDILSFTDGDFFLLIIRPIVLVFFLLCSGVSSKFSRNNYLHSMKIAFAAILMSASTILIDQFYNLGIAVYFNVLHLLALVIFIHASIETLIIRRKKNRRKFVVFIELFIAILLSSIVLSFKSYISFTFINLVLGLNILDLPLMGDYLPLCPWMIFYFLGLFFAEVFYDNKLSLFEFSKVKDKLEKTVSLRSILFIGRHSLIFYLLHQPIFLLLVYLLDLLI